jgi:putative membrane protein
MKAFYLTAAIAVFAAPVLVQSTNPATAAMAEVSTPQFVKTVAISDMFEIQSSQLAAQMSKNADVQEFAATMIKDHTKTSNELKSLVKQGKTNATIPSQMDEKHTQMLSQLKSASGANFDRSYKQIQVQAHQEAVDLFQSYSQKGDNAELRAWAGKTLPALKQHLQHVQNLQVTQQTGDLQK